MCRIRTTGGSDPYTVRTQWGLVSLCVFGGLVHIAVLCTGSCVYRRRCPSRGAAVRPHQLQPRTLLPAAPNDSAPYPVCHRAGAGHDSHGSLDESVCPCVKPVDPLRGVKALQGPDISVVRFLKVEVVSPLLTVAI